MLFGEECRCRDRSSRSSICGLKYQTTLYNLGQLLEVLEQAERQSATDFISLPISRKVVDRLVEGRIGGDGNSWIALKSRGGEHMNLNPRAIKSRIGCSGGAVEEEDRQVGQVGVGSIVEIDLGLRQKHLVCDSNHCVFSLQLSRWSINRPPS